MSEARKIETTYILKTDRSSYGLKATVHEYTEDDVKKQYVSIVPASVSGDGYKVPIGKNDLKVLIPFLLEHCI